MENSFQQNKKSYTAHSAFVEIIQTLIIAFLVVIPIRIFIAQPFIVNGASMDPTFENGDYLIVDQLSYRFNEPERFDIVIFRYPKDTSKFFIKRIIGLPGETVSIREGLVSITPLAGDAFTLKDDYVEYSKIDEYDGTLKNDEYFVLGDNRAESSDSRIWGPLNEEFIIGKAFLKVFPLKEFEFKPGSVLEKI